MGDQAPRHERKFEAPNLLHIANFSLCFLEARLFLSQNVCLHFTWEIIVNIYYILFL